MGRKNKHKSEHKKKQSGKIVSLQDEVGKKSTPKTPVDNKADGSPVLPITGEETSLADLKAEIVKTLGVKIVSWALIIVTVFSIISAILMFRGITKKVESTIAISITKEFGHPRIIATIQKIVKIEARKIIISTTEPLIKAFESDLQVVRGEIEVQKATVDSILVQVSKAMTLSDEISKELLKGNDEVSAKMKDLDSKIKQTLLRAQSIEGYTAMAIAAQMDDRKAFDQLKTWAKDSSFPLSSQAKRMWQDIINEHNQPLALDLMVDWPKNFDPSKKTLEQLKSGYEFTPIKNKPAMIQYIWKRSNFDKQGKRDFLATVLRNDTSLKAVEYAGYFLIKEFDLKHKPLDIDELLECWEKGMGNHKQSVADAG